MSRFKIFLLLPLCVSCTLGEDYKSVPVYSDAAVQKELGLQNGGSLVADWYKNFNDDYLDFLVETGLKNNTNIAQAKERLRQARLTVKVNRTDFLPQAGAEGGYSHQKSSDSTEYSEGDISYYKADFDASWELDIWGKGRRQTEADVAAVKSSEYGLAYLKTEIAAEIAVNYAYMIQNRENLRLAEENAALQQKIAAAVQKEYEHGLSDKTAYYQAQYLLQTVLASVPQYKNNTEVYRNALAVLTGLLPSEIDTGGKSNMFAGRYNDIGADMKKLPASVVRLRPDVRAAEQKLVAQNALVGMAVAEIYPSVNIGAMFGYAAKNAGDLFTPGSETSTYSPLINLPLLDWNKLQNNVKIRESGTAEAFAAYKHSTMQALSELKNAFSAYEAAKEMYSHNLSARENMRQAADNTLKKYKNGMVRFTEVLVSRQDLVKAQEEVISSRARIAVSAAGYYKAAGAPIYN